MKFVHLFERGTTTLKVVLIIAVTMIIAGVGRFIYVEQRREYWDSRVREMCAKDGAITVYQQIPLRPGEAPPRTPNERFASRDEPYVSRWKEEIIRERAPQVVRREVLILKRPEIILLGRQVFYSRVGGDTGISDNPSSFSCQDIKPETVEHHIFISQGVTK